MCEVMPVNRTLGLFERYKQVVMTGEPLAYEFAVRHKDVLSTWIRLQAVKVGDGVAITASDITTRKLTEDQILHVAHHDPLTGLLNRSLLRDRIGQAMEQARRNRTSAAVFFIDLDGFKKLNDTMGHSAGDSLLIQVGDRLRCAVRSSDSVIRIGGDEFVVVMPGLTAPTDAQQCAFTLLTSLQTPLWIGETLAPVTCSIGGAVFPGSATEIDELLEKADQALYSAKSLGKNQFHISAQGNRQKA
jgi:diguanylate cyclase (GGDEF)-like protein